MQKEPQNPKYHQLPSESRDYIRSYLILKDAIQNTKDVHLLHQLGDLARLYCRGRSSDDFFELFIWAGLKIDTPPMGQDYGRKILTEEQLIESQYIYHQKADKTSANEIAPVRQKPDLNKLEHQRALQVANAFVEIACNTETATKIARLRPIQTLLTSWLATVLTSEESQAFVNVTRAVLYPASFSAGWHTYNDWRNIVPDLPRGLNARDRRSVRNIIDRIDWPNKQIARAAQAIKKRLAYTR